MKIEVLDHGYVEFIETFGNDERIIESARMSTDKGFLGWEDRFECKTCGCLWRDNHDDTVSLFNADQKSCPECELKPTPEACRVTSDARLLAYLWKHKHLTPFEMAGMTIEVQLPILVAREWHRHRTQSYNEMSGRYVVLPDLYYVPSVERIIASTQPTKNKQAAGTVTRESAMTVAEAEQVQRAIRGAQQYARATYGVLLNGGVAKEVARSVIPVSQYTKMRAATDLRNWLGFLKLRMAPDAQWEIRQYANAVASIIAEKFPRTYELFQQENAA
jgi:thymidylate synthase (FAD)